MFGLSFSPLSILPDHMYRGEEIHFSISEIEIEICMKIQFNFFFQKFSIKILAIIIVIIKWNSVPNILLLKLYYNNFIIIIIKWNKIPLINYVHFKTNK